MVARAAVSCLSCWEQGRVVLASVKEVVKIRLLFFVAGCFSSMKEWDTRVIIFHYQRGVITDNPASLRLCSLARRPTVQKFLKGTKSLEFVGAR
jgi:hypothetical protein